MNIKFLPFIWLVWCPLTAFLPTDFVAWVLGAQRSGAAAETGDAQPAMPAADEGA